MFELALLTSTSTRPKGDMESYEPEEYTSPEIADFGDFAELTQHESFGDPHIVPFLGDDAHIRSSIS